MSAADLGTWAGSLGTWVAALVAVFLALRSQSNKQHEALTSRLEALDAKSEAGRARLYDKLDALNEHNDKKFVSKDVYALSVSRIESLEDRINAACHVVRERRTNGVLSS